MSTTLPIEFEINSQDFKSKVKKVSTSLKHLEGKVDRQVVKMANDFKKMSKVVSTSVMKMSKKSLKAFKKMGQGFNKVLGGLVAGAKRAGLAIGAGLAAGAAGAGLLIKRQADLERLYYTFGDSADVAREAVGKLKTQIGLSNEEILEASEELKRAGVSAEQFRSAMFLTADVSAKTGLSIAEATDGIKDLVVKTRQGVALTEGDFEMLNERFGKLAPSMIELAKQSGMSMKTFKKALSEGKISIGQYLQTLETNVTGGNVLGSAAVEQATKDIGKQTTRLLNVVEAALFQIGAAFGIPNTEALAQKLSKVTDWIEKNFTAKAVQNVIGKMKVAFETVKVWAQPAIDTFIRIKNTIYNDIIDPFNDSIGASDKLGNTFSFLGKMGKKLLEAFIALPKWIEKNEELLTTLTISAGILGGLWLGTMIPAILSSAVAFGAMAVGVVAATWPLLAIATAVVGVVAAFRNWDKIVSFSKDVWSKFKEIIGSALEYINNLGGRMYNAGMDLISGLYNGLMDKFTSVKEGIKGIGKDIISGFKDVFGIKSPSKEFEKIGKNVGLGYNKGLEKEMSKTIRGEGITADVKQMIKVSNINGGKTLSSMSNLPATNLPPLSRENKVQRTSKTNQDFASKTQHNKFNFNFVFEGAPDEGTEKKIKQQINEIDFEGQLINVLQKLKLQAN